MEVNFTQKNAGFICKLCDFKCCKNSDWNRHIETKKHIHRHNGNNLESAEIKKHTTYTCKCGKKFVTSAGLWKHNKKCNVKTEHIITDTINAGGIDIIPDEISYKELIIMLIKQNTELAKETSEFKSMMMKVLENGTYNTTNNNNNSHNKSFNLQFFLNETCKDAMNIMDFVESIQLQLSDLESVGKLGFVEGISNIITKNLKALDVTQRPVHCTDKKRETIYIKDEDKWEKEDEQKIKLRKAIKRVATKNLCCIPKFKEAHPDCNRSSSRFSDQYNKIVIEACGGSGNNDLEKEDKIIRNISKMITIEKE